MATAGLPPSLLHRVKPPIKASSIERAEPSNLTPDKRVTSTDLSTPKKLSPETGEANGSQAARPAIFAFLSPSVKISSPAAIAVIPDKIEVKVIIPKDLSTAET